MKNLISRTLYSVILVISIISCNNNKKVTRPTNGGNVPFDGKIYSNISYGSNVDHKGVLQDLKLDVYVPPVTQASQKFPLMVYIHAGGFIGGDKSGSANFCKTVSNNGLVSATINYRLGRNKTAESSNLCDGDSTNLKYAVYRAMQDTKASIRFLVENADKYSIDTNWIFISGASAGAATALFTTYMNQDSANYYLQGVEDSLGSLNRSSNNLTNSFSIKGIGSMWGALISPYLITAENAVPTIYTHGKLDPVAPFSFGNLYGCSNYEVVFGSLTLYNRLKGFGVPTVMHEDPTGGHGVFDDNFNGTNMACFFNSIVSKKYQNGYYIGEDSSCE